MKVLIITTERQTYVENWPEDNTLRKFQAVVGGWIEAVSGPGFTAYINEEGKLQGLPQNVTADDLIRVLGWRGAPWDVIVGNVVIVGEPDDEGDDTDVTPEVLAAAGIDHD